MVKAWLIVFLFSYSPTDFSPEEDRYLGKIELPYASMNACVKAKRDLLMEGEDVTYRFICVTDDHHSGRSVDLTGDLD